MFRHDVIAIGGSLGAVDALRELGGAFPADLDAAIFVVVHIGPHGNNLLADVFGQTSSLPVETAVDGTQVSPGRIYVAPADAHLLVIDNIIRLGRGPRENMARPAIDPLFRSVGVDYGPRAIGVVLTGSLNDGAAGLADLKRCGGLTVVQNPADAAADEMPLGALRATDVDYRAPLAELGSLLAKLSRESAKLASHIPDDIRLEVDIALGRTASSEDLARIADPCAISCPACGGVLSQLKRSPPLRFRCQVGHAFTADTLATDKEASVDEALRVALRIIEERIVLTAKMAEDAQKSGRLAAAKANERRMKEGRFYAETLRRAIIDDDPTDVRVAVDSDEF